MRFLVHFLLLCLLPVAAGAQSRLAPCPAFGFKHNCFGKSSIFSSDGYEGEWQDGKPNGHGWADYANGEKYAGQFKDGKRNGQGTYTYFGGDNYVGEFRDGMRNGQGTWTKFNGEQYVGEFKNEELHGRGTYTWSDGQKYVGEFKDGNYNGQGTFTYASGAKYVGEFKDGKRNGQGTFILANGGRYVGEWRSSLRNGQGIEYRADGTIVNSGQWADGRLGNSYALDRNRFPFDGAMQIAAPAVGPGRAETSRPAAVTGVHSGTNRIPDYPVPAEPGRAETSRRAAEAEAARRRQQELEQRLATEARERERQAAQVQQQLEQRLATEARERERQTVEAEAARRRQQELERQLAQESRERERLAAEAAERSRLTAEAARRRQQELEQRLATEARERERQTVEAEAARTRQKELEQRLTAEAREREKQAAEVEAVRRRQQELEAQLAALQSQAALRPPNQAAIIRNQRRVALVIGNASYKISPLENPVNDATDVDQTLRQLGFQTTLVRNATLGQMREATRRFADQLQSADVALIYFAGHGIESNRKNYMIPVNADLKFEYELADQAYDAGNWLDMLESIKSTNAERVNIVILDACRNNSLIGARSLGRGLGRMDAPTGTFLAYSTAPGKVAADGARGERNSPFTRHLLTVMQQPGLPIEEAFKEVRRNVSRETNGAQVPWESTSLTGFFTFRQTR